MCLKVYFKIMIKKELVKVEKLLESALNTKSTGISEHLSLDPACVIADQTCKSMLLACKTKCEATEKENICLNYFVDLTEDLDAEPPPAKKQRIK